MFGAISQYKTTPFLIGAYNPHQIRSLHRLYDSTF